MELVLCPTTTLDVMFVLVKNGVLSNLGTPAHKHCHKCESDVPVVEKQQLPESLSTTARYMSDWVFATTNFQAQCMLPHAPKPNATCTLGNVHLCCLLSGAEHNDACLVQMHVAPVLALEPTK